MCNHTWGYHYYLRKFRIKGLWDFSKKSSFPFISLLSVYAYAI